MSDPAPARPRKTEAEHREYVEQMARLSFTVAFRLQPRLPDEDIGVILQRHTPLFYHALGFGEPATWAGEPDVQRISALARETARGLPPGGAARFEQAMVGQVRDFLKARADARYSVSVGVAPLTRVWPARLVAGSLKYDTPNPKRAPTVCVFHIANAVAPDSIFTDPMYLPRCFLELMDRSGREYGYDTLATHTWLNDEPRWLRLFPEEWQRNLDDPPADAVPAWHFGYWGQLVTARGTFNAKAGAFVREHGRLRYRMRGSRCSFRAMREHLAARQPG